MKKKIVYMMSGAAYLPYLVVSIHSLRKFWDGEIEICSWPDPFPVTMNLMKDSRLNVQVSEWQPERLGRNSHFEFKASLAQKIKADQVLFIDADTIVCKPLDRLFEKLEEPECEFVGTQFCDWTSTGNKISGRIARMQEFPEIDQNLIQSLLTNKWPSVNTGVFACDPKSDILETWKRWTAIIKSVFIPDETAMHAVMAAYAPSKRFHVLGGQYNCSTKFMPENWRDEDVVVWHGHRGCFTRPPSNGKPAKSAKGIDLWWPLYKECMIENIGGIRDWRTQINYKNLNALEEWVDAGMQAVSTL